MSFFNNQEEGKEIMFARYKQLTSFILFSEYTITFDRESFYHHDDTYLIFKFLALGSHHVLSI